MAHLGVDGDRLALRLTTGANAEGVHRDVVAPITAPGPV
jgi:hypothetical protein